MQQKMNLKLIPLVVLVGLLTFFVGAHVGATSPAFLSKSNIPLFGNKLSVATDSEVKVETNLNDQQPSTVDMADFWRVWDLIHRDHIDRANFNDSELVKGAISGMVNAIGDPYTVYLPPQKNQEFKESLSGKYSGIGAELGMDGTQLIIVTPLDDSPAFRAGIQAGDRILQINGNSTQNLTVPEAVQKIRGPAGETVTLNILHNTVDAQPADIALTRAEITVKSVKVDNQKLAAASGKENNAPVPDYQAQGIAYIRMSRFGDTSVSEWDTAVRTALSQKPSLKVLILDLRNNPGGYLNSAIDIAGDFVAEGTPVVIQENTDGSKNTFTALGDERFVNTPVVILVNEGSASASEILAASLKENRNNVTIVGKKTFGKGTVQEKRELTDGGGVNITIAKWLTPKGTWVHKSGLVPEIEVDVKPEDVEKGIDAQLLKAIEIAQGMIK